MARLPKAVVYAAERFAEECGKHVRNGVVSQVGAEDGHVLWINFDGDGFHESYVRLSDGDYYECEMYKEAWDGQLSGGR